MMIISNAILYTAYRIEDARAIVVVEVGIHTVDSNCVHTERLHESSVSKAVILVGQWIASISLVEARATTRLVSDTYDLISISCGIVDEVATLDVNGRYSGG